jgi:hypothetical protein
MRLPRRSAPMPLARASEREKAGARRAAMGRARVSPRTARAMPSPGRRRCAAAATLFRFKARKRENEMA